MNYEKLSDPMEVNFPQEWFDMNNDDHFWFSWRQSVLRQLLIDNSLPIQSSLKALDIGCGIGLLRRQLESFTRWTVDGADVDQLVLEKIIPGRGKTYLYRIEDHTESFREKYDVLILFDVIEHIEDPADFLRKACWHLKPGGYLVVNVPALNLLYSAYDRLVGHHRRYSMRSFRDLIEKLENLKLVDLRYWGFLLVPVALLRKLVVGRVKTADKAIEIGFSTPSNWINHFFQRIRIAETFFLKHPVIGTSLMAIIRKSQ